MPRQTRSQRRARREAQEASGAGRAGSSSEAPPGGTPPAPRVANGGDGPDRGKGAAAVDPASGKAARKYPGSGLVRFVGESSAELKKVEWPTQSQLVTGTTVVLIACLITGFYLYINDQIWKEVVQKIFLR